MPRRTLLRADIGPVSYGLQRPAQLLIGMLERLLPSLPNLLRDRPAELVVMQPNPHKMPPIARRISEAISGVKQAQVVPKEYISAFQVKNKCVFLGEKLDHVKSFDLLVAQLWNVLAARRSRRTQQRPP